MEIRFSDGEFSNFHPSRFFYEGYWYDTVEAYFQSQKFITTGERPSQRVLEYQAIIRNADSPMKTKLLGTQRTHRFANKWKVNKISDHRLVHDVIQEYKDLQIRDGWEDIKVDIMYEGLIEKFGQNKHLLGKLIGTLDAEIIEVNPREEGRDGSGQNILGQLLMKVRDYYRA